MSSCRDDETKKHLTAEGLEEIKQIKAGMNKGRVVQLNNIKPVGLGGQ